MLLIQWISCYNKKESWQYGQGIIFKASALWADAFYKSKCPSVCVSVLNMLQHYLVKYEVLLYIVLSSEYFLTEGAFFSYPMSISLSPSKSCCYASFTVRSLGPICSSTTIILFSEQFFRQSNTARDRQVKGKDCPAGLLEKTQLLR